MSKIEKIKGWYVGEGLDEVSEEEAGKSRTDFEFVGSDERCEGRTVVVVCGVDVGRGLALSAVAGAGGIVTVLIDEVSDMREYDGELVRRDEVEMMYKAAELMEHRKIEVYVERDEVADAQRRKSWQTCYGPAQRGIKRR